MEARVRATTATLSRIWLPVSSDSLGRDFGWSVLLTSDTVSIRFRFSTVRFVSCGRGCELYSASRTGLLVPGKGLGGNLPEVGPQCTLNRILGRAVTMTALCAPVTQYQLKIRKAEVSAYSVKVQEGKMRFQTFNLCHRTCFGSHGHRSEELGNLPFGEMFEMESQC